MYLSIYGFSIFAYIQEVLEVYNIVMDFQEIPFEKETNNKDFEL